MTAVTSMPAHAKADDVSSPGQTRRALPARFERIQLLRFGAALAVVLFHALGTGQKYFPGRSHLGFASNGDLGVDVFFCISGFIIFVAADARERRWTFFLRRRLERLVPLYWIATFAMAALLAIPGISNSPPPDLTYVASSLFYLSWTLDRLPIVYPGWTLECEMVFYAIVTVGLAVAAPTWRLVLAVLGASALAGMFATAMWPDFRPAQIAANPMYLEFALGVVAAHLIARRPLSPIACLPCVLALAAMPFHLGEKEVWRVLVAGLPGAVLVFVAAARDRARGAARAPLRPLVALGDASYSIYLVQAFVISIGCKVLRLLWRDMPVDLAILLLTVATLVAAWMLHVWVERPIARILHRRDPGAAAR